MSTVLSLFDRTGSWPEPYRLAGHRVVCVDLQGTPPMNVFDITDEYLESLAPIRLVLAAVPCTDFSGSGAQYWPRKDRDGTTEKSVALVRKTLEIIRYCRKWDTVWAIENPAGRLPRLVPEIGKPRYFDPWEYADYLNAPHDVWISLDKIRLKNGEGVSREEVQMVIKWNAYTKRTGLWGRFIMPRCRALFPVRCCKQGSPLQLLGGKSENTKNIRSVTPAGFAQGFYEANKLEE